MSDTFAQRTAILLDGGPRKDGTYDNALVFVGFESATSFVICHAFNPNTRQWYHGSYYSDLSRAMEDWQSRKYITEPSRVMTPKPASMKIVPVKVGD